MLSNTELRMLQTVDPIPVNIAPTKHLFMYNRHHTVRALYESDIPATSKWFVDRSFLDFSLF